MHYVYEHVARKDGKVFYVGKGVGNRANATIAGRNRRWKEIATDGFDVRMVIEGLTHAEALVAECKHIGLLVRKGTELVNSANVVTIRNNRDLGEDYMGEIYYPWRNIVVPAKVCKTVAQMVREEDANEVELNAVLDGQTNVTSDGWVINRSKS